MEKAQLRKEYRVFLRLLKEARRKALITQLELAVLLGETQSFVSKCERGERRLDVVEARKFCTAIGLDFGKFAASLNKTLK